VSISRYLYHSSILQSDSLGFPSFWVFITRVLSLSYSGSLSCLLLLHILRTDLDLQPNNIYLHIQLTSKSLIHRPPHTQPQRCVPRYYSHRRLVPQSLPLLLHRHSTRTQLHLEGWTQWRNTSTCWQRRSKKARTWQLRQSATSPERNNPSVRALPLIPTRYQGQKANMNSLSHSPPATNSRPHPQARSHRPRHPKLHLRHQERHRHPRRERCPSDPLQRILHCRSLSRPAQHTAQGSPAVQPHRCAQDGT
jgi:hypothetical protein